MSLFGGDDFENEQNLSDDTDQFLESVELSLSSIDIQGPAISAKIAKIVNEKFASGLSLEERKEISEK